MPDTHEINTSHYDSRWRSDIMAKPHLHAIWPLIQKHTTENARMLEVGPGNNPKLPLGSNTYFLDISNEAIKTLTKHGAQALLHNSEELPFDNDTFDLVCAYHLIEHLPDDVQFIKETRRILKPDGICILAMPLFENFWTSWDNLVGHERRFEPDGLANLLKTHAFSILEVYSEKDLFAIRPLYKLGHEIGSTCFKKAPSFFQLLQRSYTQTRNRFNIQSPKPHKAASLRDVKDPNVILVCQNEKA